MKNRRKAFGQHFLQSQNVAQRIVDSAGITKKDVVLEIGTGKGVLIPFLCRASGRVISYEADPELAKSAKMRFSHLANLEVVCGDGFKTQSSFSVFVSNLPYSKSRQAIEWLAQQRFSKAIVMVQREFADKMAASSLHGAPRRAVSVISGYAFAMTRIMGVARENFVPSPKVDSVVLKLVKRNCLSASTIKIINEMFSYRRKKLANILGRFGMESGSSQRLDDLSDVEIVDLAKMISDKRGVHATA